MTGALAVDVLRLLQQQLLVAVLTQTPLPGQSARLQFPDLALILEQPEKIVSRDNLAGEPAPSLPATFLSDADIRARTQEQAQVPVLHFREPESLDGRVRIALELRMHFRDVPPLPLGAVIATFAEVPGVGWRAVEQPAALGY